MDSHELVTVGSYPNSALAHLARIRLEAEGIDVVIEDEHLTSLSVQYGPAIGGVKVRVCETDREAAFNILHGQRQALEEKRLVCPRCESADVVKGKHLTFLAAVRFFPLGIVKHRMSCRACKHAWRE